MANDIRPIIQNRINKLNMLIDAKTRDLQNAPRGSIYASMSHGKAQFCHIDSKKTYIRSSDESLIYLLSQKKYDENVIKCAQKENKVLTSTLKALTSIKQPEEVFNETSPLFQPFVKPIIVPESTYRNNWESAPFRHKAADTHSPFVTKKGEVVRSKSELLIANLLFDMNIPYRYEAELVLNDVIYHPDFTILDLKRRREVYHEHLGLMDNTDYAISSIERIRVFQQNNILLSDRLFISMETKVTPLDIVSLAKEFERFR
ncbi:MAG: hypothetical protein J6U54_09355 [Clostridiales bacterium]|nr:hypothetical protein [Clostridiales bacterium]